MEALILPRSKDRDIDAVDTVSMLEQLDSAKSDASELGRDSPPILALSFSDSSNESPVDFASLFGEAIESRGTTSTFDDETRASINSRQIELPDDPPLPSLFPKYRPLPIDKDSDSILDLTDDCKKCVPLLPPQSADDADTVRSVPSNSTSSLLQHFVGRVVGHTDLMGMVACPCCQQCLEDPAHATESTLIEPQAAPGKRESMPKDSRGLSLLSAAESEDEEEYQLEDDMMTGVLREGVCYRISRVLVEGLLHKKGTGHDWLGSRSWKSRWARLALGHIEGYGDVAVPLLCISWYPSSSINSTVIVLDSTVVMAVDLPNKEKGNSNRFEIRHASSRLNSSLPVTRTFSAPSRKARDAWVYAISEALLTYEKEKAEARKLNPGAHSRHQSPLRQCPADRSKSPTRTFDEAWTGDHFTTVDRPMSSICSRPPSPTSPHPPRRNKASPPLPKRSASAKRGSQHVPKVVTQSNSA
jgi:PH domain